MLLFICFGCKSTTIFRNRQTICLLFLNYLFFRYSRRTNPRWSCFGAALGVDGVLRVAELVEQVEGFYAGDELALEEGLADGGVQHEVVGVQLAAAIAATGHHRNNV